jgi:ComF family protein
MLQQSFSRINNWFYAVFRTIIAPPLCAHCKKFLDVTTVHDIFCENCSGLIFPIASREIPITKKYNLTVLAVSVYAEPVKSLILAKHWSDVVASRQLGDLIWQKTNFKNIPCDYLVPIPLHWTRYAHRGFNQTDEIAHVLAQKREISIAHLLARTKKTRFQADLSREQRSENIKNAFELTVKNKKLYEGKHLWLVDDLMTTGATLEMAARELCKLRPATIHAIVACRTK